MTGSEPSRADANRAKALGNRFSANVAAIRARALRVGARQKAAPRLSTTEWIAIWVSCFLIVLAAGFAFDAISVARARAVPRFIHSFFEVISDAGKSQWELWPAGLFFLFLLFGSWGRVPRFVRAFWAEVGALSAFVFASIGGVGLLVNIFKQPIGRGRPPTFDEFGALTLQPLHFAWAYQSFPSGHSATGGALIALGFLIFTRWRIGLLLFGLLIGASRVVVGAHYPSDVTAGLLLGFGFTMWLAAVFARAGWAFRRGRTGTITARLGTIRGAWRSPARTVTALAGLVDAMAGRPRYIPALASLGDRGDARLSHHREPIDGA